ncbi:hypothetical protein D9M69_554140 [compost metagenome]
MRVVADVQHLRRLHAGGLRRRMEDAHIGFAHAKGASVQRRVEMGADTDAVHVGVAIGQRHHRKSAGQEFERGQRVLKQHHPVPLGKKHLKGGLRQRRVFARALQQPADRLAAQAAHVQRQVGSHRRHLVARLAQGVAVAAERGGGGRMLVQPGLQPAFGARDRGPDRPERVVQVERDGADARNVQASVVHRRRGQTRFGGVYRSTSAF